MIYQAAKYPAPYVMLPAALAEPFVHTAVQFRADRKGPIPENAK
jgi:hypothetical protein